MAYLNVGEIESALTSLAAAYPAAAQLLTPPHSSVEGRTSRILRVGRNSAGERPGILITGGVHAREWVGSEICVSLAADVLEAWDLGTGLTYGGTSFTAGQVRSILDSLNLFFFADVNPDGRHHSQNVAALWRRNRNPAQSGGNPSCIGVDLNRNFDFLWDFENRFSAAAVVNTAADPCAVSQTYRGSAPASEPEVRNVAWVLDTFPRVGFFVDLHSHGEVLLYSWGDDDNQTADPGQAFTAAAFDSVRGVDGDNAYREYVPPQDLAVLVALAEGASSGIHGVRGRSYTIDQAFGLYATSGAGDDYAYSRHFASPAKSKVYSFTFECGTSFQPAWGEAEHVIREVSAGLLAFALEARDHAGPSVGDEVALVCAAELLL